MFDDLENDLKRLRGQKNAEAYLYKKHEVLALSYPGAFYKTVKGEIEPHMLRTILEIKSKMDTGEISSERARELVIDGAKSQIESLDSSKRPKQSKSQAQNRVSHHQFSLSCQVDADGSRFLHPQDGGTCQASRRNRNR